MFQEWFDFLDNLEFRSLDEQFLRELGPMIMEIIRNPLSNTPAAVVLLLIAVVILFILFLAAVVFISSITEDEEEYEYVVVAADGTEEPVPATRQDKAPVAKDPLRYHRALLWAAGFTIVLLVAGGLSSQSRAVCLSCHDGIPHTAQTGNEAHQSVSCTRCHESSGTLGSYTLAVPARMAHIVTGLFSKGPGSAYGVVAGRSCLNCHGAVVEGVAEIPDRALLVSHPEPLEAGAGCMDCHRLDEDAKLGRATAGMGVCLRCHDDVQASADCSTCHTGDVSQAVLTSRTHEARQIISQPDCYTCHDPASCDSCHGVRLPHPQQYVWSHMMDAARDIWFNAGRTCTACHTAERNSCYQAGCHVGELDFHRGEDPTFPRNHDTDPDWWCDNCHVFAARLDDPCQMCHQP